MNEHPPRVVACCYALLVGLVCFISTASAADSRAEPLHSRIDRIMEAERVGPMIAMASDAEFLRRVSIDLTGTPPSVDELRAFLADKAVDKRDRAIDRLLESPLFARQWATTLDIMLMERRAHQNVTQDEWQDYLLRTARENRPINELIAEILRSDGTDPKLRPAARFYLDRELEPNLITRDVGRIFFGRDLQCAHCHNHPLVDDYKQSDYQGLLAFFNAGFDPTTKPGAKKTAYPEKAGTDVAFDSVFVKGDQHLTGPRLPGGTEVPEPVFPPGEEYRTQAAGQAWPVPKHSRRATLATMATDGSNRLFNENIANRLWATMMGRGLVHPVDLNHPANPPSHPALMKLLGEEIAAMRFDAKAFLRELALTRAYQSAIDLPANPAALPVQFDASLADLNARTALLEVAAERAGEESAAAEKAWHQAENALIPVVAERDKAIVKHAEVAKQRQAAEKAAKDARAKIAARGETARALAEAAARAQDVVKKLPKEKDLAEAARLFASRSASAATELTSLEKAGLEKTSALTNADLQLATAAKLVETAQSKIQPVRDSVRQREETVLEKRQKKAESRTALEVHQKRIGLLEALARRKALQDQAATIARTIDEHRGALKQAEKLYADHTPSWELRQRGVKATELARSAAEKHRGEAQSGLESLRAIANRVAAALAATEAARSDLPDDAALSDAAGKLKTKSDELKSGISERRARFEEATNAVQKAGEGLAAAELAFKTSTEERLRREQAVGAVQAALTAADARAKALRSKLAEVSDELVDLLGNRFALAQLKPLTPEQMCWSILEVTGVYDRYRRVEEEALNKAKPLDAAAIKDSAVKRARDIEIEQRTFDKLKSTLPPFIRIYGAGAGQPQNDFFATADQALFAANGGSINGWVAPAGGNISERMAREKEPHKAAEDLYLTILSRPPSAEETADVVRLLNVPPKDQPAAVHELVWGLLTSAEFRFNH